MSQTFFLTLWQKDGVIEAMGDQHLGEYGHHFMLAVKVPASPTSDAASATGYLNSLSDALTENLLLAAHFRRKSNDKARGFWYPKGCM